MKRLILLGLALVSFLFLFPKNSLAHPGRTDSSGCHTCRTNCPDWGLSYGEYHCHGGYTAPEPVYVAPAATITPSTPKPVTPKPTIKPTATPTQTPTTTPTITPTATPTSSPMVEGASTSSSNGSGWLALPGGLIAWILWKYRHTFGKKKEETENV